MERFINLQKKFFLFCVSFFLLGTLSSCDSLSSRTDAEHVAAAKDARDQGDLKASVIELKNALRKNPDNAEARRLLGVNYVRFGSGAAAEKELRRALDLGVAKGAILIHLAEALQLQGKNQHIVDEIDALNSLDASDQATLVAFRGDAWLAVKKPEKALSEYQRALGIDNNSALAKLGLARISLTKGDSEKALALVSQALKVSQEEAKLWSFQADLYNIQGEADKADESYGKAIKLRRNNYVDRAKRAVLLIDMKDFEPADREIQILKQAVPDYFMAHFAEGRLKLEQKKFREAQSALEKAVRLDDRHLLSHYYLGVSYLLRNNLSQAEHELKYFLTAKPNSSRGHQLLALTQFRRKNFESAKEMLLPVVKFMPDDVFSNNLMSAIEFGLGNSEKGLNYLQRVTELNPNSSLTHARLGLSQLLTGGKDKGVAALETALEINPELTGARVYIALIQIKSKEYRKATETIEHLKKVNPEDPMTWNLLGMLEMAQDDNESAKIAYQKAIRLAPADISASHNLAIIYSLEQNYGKARSLYEQVLEKHPDHIRTSIRLAELDAREDKLRDMHERLNEVVEKSPTAIAPKLILARYYLRFGEPARAETLIETIRVKLKNNPEVLGVLTEAQLAQKQLGRALGTAQILTRTAPNSAQAQFILAKTYEAKGDVDDVRKALEKSLELDPEFFRSRVAMVRLLGIEKRYTHAEKLLNELSEEFPKNVEVMALRGWIALRRRRPNEAIHAYSKALEQEPSSSLTIDLARTQWAAGKKEDTLRTLKHWNQRYPKDTLVKYALSGFYANTGNTVDSIKQLQEILNIDPKNVIVLNDLAWRTRKNNPTQALKYAELATDLAPKSALIMDTLGMVLIENSRYERALRIMEKAHKMAPKNLSIQYHLAIVQEKNGQPTNAIKILKDILNQKRNFDEDEKAQMLLKKLSHS